MDGYPLPRPDPTTAPYWLAASMGSMVLPQCVDCGRHHLYPKNVCPFCSSSELRWTASSGRGKVYTFTVITRPPSPAFGADVPYIVAVVALDEGPHLMTNIVDCDIHNVHIDMPVTLAFKHRSNDVVLPVFKPVPAPTEDGNP